MIKVVDSIMGSGKTSAAIYMMNEDTENSYIYITPYLSEAERIKKSCPDRRFYEPKTYSEHGEVFMKLDSLHELLKARKNIATTHSLFQRSTEETREILYNAGYILILDECIQVVQTHDINTKDVKMLFENEWLLHGENNLVLWNEEKEKAEGEYDGVFKKTKELAQNKNLIIHNDTILLWNFPADMFRLFKDAYLLTYLFDGSLQRFYYDVHDIQHTKYIAVHENDKYTIRPMPKNYTEKPIKDELRQKIHIYEGSLNKIGEDYYALSMSWYEKKRHLHTMLKNNIYNYFWNVTKSKSDMNLWTTFDAYKGKMKGKGYSKGYAPCNARATNEYRERSNISYVVNRFLNPILDSYFKSKNIQTNHDLYSLSELVQFIWRSAIRDGNEINLYIPSSRMRELLYKWLDNEY